jgi:hypothetical protein
MQKKKLLSGSRESMTLPDERYRAVKWAESFLQRLAGGEFPRVPKAVREEARSILRHYPSTYDLDRCAARSPDVFAESMEPLYKMILSKKLQDDIAEDMGIDKLEE